MPAPPTLPDPKRTLSFVAATRERRAADFLVILGAAALIIAGAVLFGAIDIWSALFAIAALGVFCLAYYLGTQDLEGGAIRAARAAAIEELREEREASGRAFRVSMVEALPEPAMYIDANGKVEAANAAARRRFRFVGAEPLLTVVVRRSEFLNAVEAAGRERIAQRFEFVERDETDRHYACTAAPIHSPDSRGVLVTMHDLTEIRRAELARVDFLANASHELRTPLTSLAGFIETLRGPARNDPEARDRFLDIMHAQAERMRRLISDLMSLSRIELIEHRPPEGKADLAAVVAEVGDALLPVATSRNVRLRVAGPASGVWVAGVHDELTQVVQNLIDNAIKYSEAGGIVEIELLTGLSREEASVRAARRWQGAGHMSIAAASRDGGGPWVALRVSDAGPGIDRKHLPRLAERFYRVDQGRELRPGTGLGLAIVKHIVTRHRGEFLVESELGRGSAFAVVLPLYRAGAATDAGSLRGTPQLGQAG